MKRKKVKVAVRANKKAQSKLLDLVTTNAKKKKILKQISLVQGLDKEEKKLRKKLKASLKKTVKKSKASSKKIKKSKKNEPEVLAVAHDNTVVITRSKSKAVKMLHSNSYNAKMAIRKLQSMHSSKDLKTFIADEVRRSVLERAESRRNAILNNKK